MRPAAWIRQKTLFAAQNFARRQRPAVRLLMESDGEVKSLYSQGVDFGTLMYGIHRPQTAASEVK
ncbi:MAG: hypothetical protein SVV80_14225 [Planctomycetota bacterium]|nr:hypothetical protein [Planctomycetota bacterium]